MHNKHRAWGGFHPPNLDPDDLESEQVWCWEVSIRIVRDYQVYLSIYIYVYAYDWKMSYIVYAYVSVLFVITRNDSNPRFSGVTFIALLHGLEQETIGNNKKSWWLAQGLRTRFASAISQLLVKLRVLRRSCVCSVRNYDIEMMVPKKKLLVYQIYHLHNSHRRWHSGFGTAQLVKSNW